MLAAVRIALLNRTAYVGVLCVFLFFGIETSSAAPDGDSSSIRIGVITSLEPIAAPWAQSANLGLKKAVEEINRRGGVGGRRIELVIEDDRFMPKNALSAYYKLRNVDKVHFIIGPQFDQTMAAVRHLAAKDEQLLIQTIGTNPVSTEAYPYVVHSYPADKFAGEALAKRIIRDGHKRISFIVPQESYSQYFAGHVRAHLQGIDYQSLDYEPDNVDYKLLLLKARAYAPTALVFLFLMPDVAAQAYQKMRSLGLDIPVYTNEQLHGHKDFAAQAGAIADPTLYFIVDFDENSHAVRAFLASLPQSPTLPLYSVVAYDTMQWLAALVAENGTDNRKVKDALYKMTYKGLFTTYAFDDRGDLRESHWVPWKVTAEGYLRLHED